MRLLTLVALLPFIAPANAADMPMPRFEQVEVPCMPAEAAIKEIMGPRYGELPLFDASLPNPQGSEGDQASVTVTVFANPKTGTWTMMVAPNPMMRCIIMAGKDFRPAAMPKQGRGS